MSYTPASVKLGNWLASQTAIGLTTTLQNLYKYTVPENTIKSSGKLMLACAGVFSSPLSITAGLEVDVSFGGQTLVVVNPLTIVSSLNNAQFWVDVTIEGQGEQAQYLRARFTEQISVALNTNSNVAVHEAGKLLTVNSTAAQDLIVSLKATGVQVGTLTAALRSGRLDIIQPT